jgi:hypothetical protein
MTDTNIRHYVTDQLWSSYHCQRQTPPVTPSLPTTGSGVSATAGGLLDSAVCRYNPKQIRVQLALYQTDAQSKAGWLQLEGPYGLGENNGFKCNSQHLGGASGEWHHGAGKEVGGWRFCSIKSDGEGVIAWTLLSNATHPHSILAVATQGKGEVDFHLTEWWKGCRHHFGEGMAGVAGMAACAGVPPM